MIRSLFLFLLLLVQTVICASEDAERLLAYERMGELHEERGDRDRAFFWYTLGMKMHPGFYEARFVRWGIRAPEDLEKKIDSRRPFPKGEMWSRQMAAGSLVYVYAEEGLGDTLQFSRYLHDLVEAGYRIIFCPQQPLHEIFSVSFPSITVVDEHVAEEQLPYDCYLPLLSLPHHFWTPVEQIPRSDACLAVDAERVKRFYQQVFATDNNFKVGLVWQGCPDRFNDANRSIPLEAFLPLTLVEGISLYSLQVGYGCEQLTDDLSIIDLGSTFNNLADAAAALINLDLLITVDTSVAHLAGALGVETWTLIPYFPDWRWFFDGDQTPWYDTMTLFRQEGYGDWKPVIDTITQELEERCISEI